MKRRKKKNNKPQEKKEPEEENNKPQDGYQQRLLLHWLSETSWFTVNLVRHPINTVLSRLKVTDHKKRFIEAFEFLAEMLVLWFIIEMIIFYLSEIRDIFRFFAVQLVAYVLVSILYALILHGSLRMFRVPSDLQRTLPCYFYATAIAIPLYAILSYPSDLLDHLVIKKAGIEILLHPVEYSRIATEILDQLGRNYKIGYFVSVSLVNVWSLVVFAFLSVVLWRFYRTRYLRCFFATLLVYIFISFFEPFVVKPLSAKVDVVFSQASRPNTSQIPAADSQVAE